MKNKFRYIAICLCGAGIVSCNDFLKDDSGDLLIPKNVMEFIPVLIGEGYPRSFNSDCEWFALMTDDVEMGVFEKDPNSTQPEEGFDVSWGKEGRQVFKWDMNIEERLADDFWSKRYANILGCNTIISQLPFMEYTEVQTGKYNYLAAQAYTLRAYNYFCLINTYALPWAENNLDKLGVVLRDSPEISSQPRERESIRSIYKFINDDLIKASEYMKKAEASANKHLITPAALRLLQNRIDLFQEKWDDVIKGGEEFIKEFPSIHNLNVENEDKLGGTDSSDPYIFDLSKNNEIVFTFGNSSDSYSFLSSYTTLWSIGFRVSYPHESDNPNYTDPNKPLISCYEANDLRKLAYFNKDILKVGMPIWGIPDEYVFHYHYPVKFRNYGSTGYHECWRTVEVYLNLAEAYARKATNISAEAVNLLNRLRICRIRASQYTALTVGDFTSKQELVEFIWEERRRELCFEEVMRWWDLRRQGMPRLEHRLLLSNTEYETYILEKGSNNYTLAIPRSESIYNDLITGNPRDEIRPLQK